MKKVSGMMVVFKIFLSYTSISLCENSPYCILTCVCICALYENKILILI